MLSSMFAICVSEVDTMLFIRTDNISRHSGSFGKQIHDKWICSEGTCSFFLILKAFACHLQGLWLSLTSLATVISFSAVDVLVGPSSRGLLRAKFLPGAPCLPSLSWGRNPGTLVPPFSSLVRSASGPLPTAGDVQTRIKKNLTEERAVLLSCSLAATLNLLTGSRLLRDQSAVSPIAIASHPPTPQVYFSRAFLIRCGRHLHSPRPKHRPVTVLLGEKTFLGELLLVWGLTWRIYLRWNNAEKPHSDGRQGDREVHLDSRREQAPLVHCLQLLAAGKRTAGPKGERTVV